MPRIIHLERKRRHQTPDHNKARRDQHATFAAKSIGHIAEDQDSDDRADEKGVRYTRLSVGSVDLFAQDVAEDDVC